ncbi:CDP-6-deoxy-L-threo-D-glycero-4-hexulose-3-dehydrase reductase [Neisseria meningitidis NM3081]|nr:CDP-6-deoxy-L-threo-D-glycero-4-hexulose-3-dehydrase reductase [Neisseria meningitidis NM3081]
MNHTITLPDQTTFAAGDGETVLAAASRQNLNLPHSCKSGVCGQCKAELVSGNIQMGGHSEQALSEAEKAQGKILMCCTTVQSDISINIPGYKADALPVRTLPARIESIIFKHDVALLKLALPKAPPFAFYAGQYIDLLLPGNVSRSYSIANSPDQEGILELHIRRRENGVCSEMIFGSEPKVKKKASSALKARSVRLPCRKIAANPSSCWQPAQATPPSAASCSTLSAKTAAAPSISTGARVIKMICMPSKKHKGWHAV